MFDAGYQRGRIQGNHAGGGIYTDLQPPSGSSLSD